MKYLKTKHERNSAKITALIVMILVLLLFVVRGCAYQDPPEEYGVAINFGNSPVGSGNIQPTEPIKSQPTEKVVEESTDADDTESEESTEANSQSDEVITNQSAEEIAIEKAKAEAAKAQAEADRIAKEEQEKKDKLKALIDGVANSEGPTDDGEGPDDGPGDKGDLDGSPYAPYEGTPGSGNGGVGYGLNGRGAPKFDMFDGCENEYGLIVVDIVVNRNGEVIEATPGARGSNNATSCLKAQAKKIAKSYKWPADSKAPARQYGKVSVNFTPTN